MAAVLQPSLAPWPRVPGRLAGIGECVVLALLIHLLLIAIFGTVPGGTARPGEGVFGALNVRLAGKGPPRAETPPAPEAYTGPRGEAAERRYGGAVRESTP